MHQKDIFQTLKELNSTATGLSTSQAEQRLHKYGLNELKVKGGVHPLKILFQQFSSPLVLILMAALAISIFLGEKFDAIIIAIIIGVNAALGFFQEFKAEKAIEALKKMASPKATVLRNNKETRMKSKYLVPGDIIILETGDKIPADSRLIEIHSLQTQEGALTGESNPVTKILDSLPIQTPLADRKNIVYGSTTITNGRGRAVVISTGMLTEVGKIAKLITEAQDEQTPLQKELKELGKYLTIAVLIVAVVVFLAGILQGQAASTMFLTAIALAVAAIPEGLPAVITISLAIGVQRMVKKNALVRKLPSVETLGSVNVICTDKTGTLTHNEMTVTKIWANNKVIQVTGTGYDPEGEFTFASKPYTPKPLEQLLTIGAFCNNAKLNKNKKKWEVIGDPTEAALLVSAKKAALELNLSRTEEIPFSSSRKMMTVLAGKKSYTKGAADILITKCDRILLNGRVVRLTREITKTILDENQNFANNALRVLGFAYNENVTDSTCENNMIFVGLQAMIDPPREEVKDAIATCQVAGIRVIMITGDQIETAKAIAAQLGIEGKAIGGIDFEKINLHQEIEKINIFARVNPEHKLRIVQALKKKGYVVAMTGDGVNDAPALKKADIGIAMGISGTDVAKEASDMILTDDNFTSIVNAVKEGRGIFDNIRKFAKYMLSSNLGEITVILFASLYSFLFVPLLGLPLTAVQILWINLVTDGLPATALGLDPYSPGIMQKKPRPTKESILSKEIQLDIMILGVLIGIFSLVLFILYQESGILKAQTMVFTSLVTFELVRLYTIRRSYQLGIFSNKLLLGAVILSILLHLTTIYTPASKWFKTTPLEFVDWGILIVASIALFSTYKLVMKLLSMKISWN